MTQMPDFPLSPGHQPPPQDPEDPDDDPDDEDDTSTTQTFHPKIVDVDLIFAEHSIIPGIAAPMNQAYSFNFIFEELLQEDGNNFRDSTTVIRTILYKLATYIIHQANNTDDTTPILNIVLKKF